MIEGIINTNKLSLIKPLGILQLTKQSKVTFRIRKSEIRMRKFYPDTFTYHLFTLKFQSSCRTKAPLVFYKFKKPRVGECCSSERMCKVSACEVILFHTTHTCEVCV